MVNYYDEIAKMLSSPDPVNYKTELKNLKKFDEMMLPQVFASELKRAQDLNIPLGKDAETQEGMEKRSAYITQRIAELRAKAKKTQIKTISLTAVVVIAIFALIVYLIR
ncbi:hypothetical protein [Succinatimonas hippei]|uniref:hypothetical protein n=1 Tax=Succinatimonas hippei TaxID=626938 RepID=UPI0025DB09C7|nr:hypothetical protein [Succinatimonas hippei]